jgi:hypothetical protein
VGIFLIVVGEKLLFVKRFRIARKGERTMADLETNNKVGGRNRTPQKHQRSGSVVVWKPQPLQLSESLESGSVGGGGSSRPAGNPNAPDMPLTPLAAHRRSSLRSTGMSIQSDSPDSDASLHLSSPRSSIHLDLETSQAPSGSAHSYELAEKSGFARHINYCLQGDSSLSHLLPLDPTSDDLFVKNADGLLLCKLVNMIWEGAVDMSTINTKRQLNIFQMTENINAAIIAAKKLGISVVNIGADDIIAGK